MKVETYNIDEITKEIIIHLSGEGVSFESIAVELGISVRTLHRYIHKFNLSMEKISVGCKVIKPKSSHAKLYKN